MSLLRDDVWLAPRFGWTRTDYAEARTKASPTPPPVPLVPTPPEGRRGAATAFLAALTPAVWMTDAACRGVDTEIYFPERGDDADLAVAFCAPCPVREQCAATADSVGATHAGHLGEREPARTSATPPTRRVNSSSRG